MFSPVFRLHCVLGALLLTSISSSIAQPSASVPPRDLYADTWAATDALGRTLPMGNEVRAPQSGKTAALFYYIWQGQHPTKKVYDITEIVSANPSNPQWGPNQAFHWWGQPEAGYFLPDDPWVIRRNMSMLADAGIDVIFFDVTNAFTYLNVVKAMGQTIAQMRAEGNATPQIAFLTNARGGRTVTQLYDEFYSKKLYHDLWFQWEGKPLILGDKEAPDDDKTLMRDEIKEFFTWRRSWAWSNASGWYGDGKGKWPWLDNTPQQPGYSPEGKLEQIVVETAQHPTTNKGKSFYNKQSPLLDKLGMTPNYDKGFHFAEQWERALEVDPPLLLITQWNEWTAQRFIADDQRKFKLMGRSLEPGETYFVDVYNAEFNRDIEPMKGGYGDNYYYQMVAGLRRFEGARPVPLASAPREIAIDGDFDTWETVGPQYRDTIGDTIHRDFAGADEGTIYRNATGRNDIVNAKVARDDRNLYFTAQTQGNLTSPKDANWMMLFIDADRNSRTGWNGYDVRVISGKIEVWRNRQWQNAGSARLAVSGNNVELSLPRSVFPRNGANLSFDFKWVDNADPNRIESWFVDGDTAPNRRFNYRYQTGR